MYWCNQRYLELKIMSWQKIRHDYKEIDEFLSGWASRYIFWTVFHEDLKNVKLTKVRPCPNTQAWYGLSVQFCWAGRLGQVWASKGFVWSKNQNEFHHCGWKTKHLTICQQNLWYSGHLYDILLTTLQSFPRKTYKFWISSTTNIWCQLLLLWFSLAFRIFVM